MPATRPDPGQGRDPSEAVLVLLLGVAALVVLAWASLAAGDLVDGRPIQANPIVALAEAARGSRPVSPLSIVVFLAVLAGLVVGGVVLAARLVGRREDRAARSMGNTGAMRGLTARDAAKTAKRLRPNAGKDDPVGIFIGRAIGTLKELLSDFETCVRVLAGARMGKTTSWAIPAIMEAPGAVLATSNKSDIIRHTHGGTGVDGRTVGRAAVGRCWVFDPQRIASAGQATFWWNPLAGVRTISDAREVAELLVDGIEGLGQSSAGHSDYFEGGGKELVAIYMLAAALHGGDLYHVKAWMRDDTDRTARMLLENGPGRESAGRLAEAQALNPRQRDGLWDMGRRIVQILDNLDYGRWITPNRRTTIAPDGSTTLGPVEHDLPQFDPARFAATRDTLYALSKEGAASAAPLLTMLIGQVIRGAEQLGEDQPTGRIDPPMIGVLDEVANICPITRLPDWYSHLGSRGVVLLSFLQAPSQARTAWGEDGARTLEGNAGTKIYAGNVADRQYLDDLSAMIGHHWISTGSTSYGTGMQGGGSVQRSWQKDAIMDTAALAALPPGRAIVQSPRTAPVLIEAVPWWERPCADEVHAAIAVWDAGHEQRRRVVHDHPAPVAPAPHAVQVTHGVHAPPVPDASSTGAGRSTAEASLTDLWSLDDE